MTKLRCPICDRELRGDGAKWPNYPFCSPRCRQIDLGRWLGEDYRIIRPTSEDADSDSDSASPPRAGQ